MIKGDIKKLPKWVQDEIARLVGEVAYWKGKATKVEAGETNVRYSHGFMEWSPLAPGSLVRFTLGPGGREIECSIGDEVGGLCLRVSGLTYPLRIHPIASNVIHIYPEKF